MRHKDTLAIIFGIVAVAFVAALVIAPDLWIICALLAFLAASAMGVALCLFYVRYRLVLFVQSQAAELASLRHMSATARRDYAELSAQKIALEKALRAAEESTNKALQAVEASANKALGAAEASANKALQAVEASTDRLTMDIETSRTKTEERLKRIETSLQPIVGKKLADEAMLRRLNTANSLEARPVTRYLSPEKRARLADHWAPLLDLQVTPSALSYLAHKIAISEDNCTGRLAAPVETALLRHLAMRSLGAGKLEILEIGTLFGLAAGLLYRGSADFSGAPYFTLLDPLDGYYGEGVLDPLTGMPISEKTLRGNLRALEVPDDSWRLIKRLSTEPEALQEAGDRQYDLILIDGDHSLEGVKADYELYADFVKPGGLLIFDDYDTAAWPAIKPYVDEHVIPDPRWEWIGGEYGTGILRRRA